MRRIIIFRHNFMKIDKLKIIEKSFLHPIIKFTNSIPGSITNPHHDDTQWVARGLHQGFTIFFDVRHLTVRNDQKYVIRLFFLHNRYGLLNEWNKRGWTRQAHPLNSLRIF
eukprot:TRINITY_DN7967_c0_g1_i3.p1 TRINITY_DN7967_c0_g1~~TRINITY_DN7967_c0_g1_i3.p1  ORF type:complete len:111 (+),score=4.36 TRINITY_DN7967_c0_g1_i3:263-595(+)